MAGQINSEKEKTRHSDILFDLTPEDDKRLTESDLLDLINYGQVKKPIKVLGVNGRVYEMDLALLWDEDHIDILKRTTAYANDPLLRIRILRRLKLYKSIQRIDNRDYSDPDAVVAKRELWAILSKMSDSHIEYLDSKYTQLELERNLQMMDAVRDLLSSFDENDQSKKKETRPQSGVDQHVAEFQTVESKKEQLAEVFTDAIQKDEKSSEKTETLKSPKQHVDKVS